MAQQFKTQDSKLKIQNCAMAQQFKTQNSKLKIQKKRPEWKRGRTLVTTARARAWSAPANY